MITEKNILEVTNTQFDKYAFQTSEGVTVITEHDFDYLVEELVKKLIIPVVVSSCVDKETLIDDLNDKRIVGVTLDENMWHYCRKETAEHLLDKYEIKTK